MAAPTPPNEPNEDGHNVGQEHFDDVVGDATAGAGGGDIHDRRVARLRELEEKGAGASPRAPVDQQEKQPHQFQSGDEVYKYSQKAKEEGQARGLKRKRGLFIGLGAGGGVISIFAGMLSLLPFKMPALMDFVNDFAGQRVEDVLEHEGEKIMLRFFLRGSNAAIANGDVIATGNPIGDLFANMRISRFEDRVLKPRGITIEPNGNGGIRIFHDGSGLGSFKNEEELLKFFNRTDLKYKDAIKVFKLLAKEDIPTWRWIKRMRVAKLFRLKYVPYLGIGQRKPEETNDEFEKRVKQLEGDQINGTNTQRGGSAIECFTSSDCDDVDQKIQEDMESRAGSVDGKAENELIQDITREATEDIAKQVTEEVAQEGIEEITKQGSSKLATLVGAGAATAGILAAVDLITTAANIEHWMSNNIENGKLIKTVAALRAAAYATFYAFFAGVGDQIKAGEMDPLAVGMFSDQFNHVAESAPYNVMNSNELKGEDVESWRKPNALNANNAFIKAYEEIWSGPMLVLRAPLIGWYYSIGWVWNRIGDAIGKGISWVIDNTPCAMYAAVALACPKELIASLTKLMVPLWQWFSDFFGFSVDAFVSNPKAFAYLAYGGQAAMDEYGKTLDFHELSPTSARQSAERIARENAEYNSSLPFFDRVFSLNNTASLASALVRTTPTLNPMRGGVGGLAFAGLRMATSLPGDLLSLTSGRAHAAGAQITLDAMMGNPDIGIDENERDQDISPILSSSGGTCTVNNDAHYDPCAAQSTVIEGWKCDISVVSLCPDGGPPTGDTTSNNPATSLPEGTAAKLAQLILDNPNITFEGNPPNYPGDGAHNDFLAVAAGKKTTNQCGQQVSLDPRLLQVILAAAGNYTDPSTGQKVPSKYKFRINAAVSDHSCNGGYHPRGEALDLGWVNGKYAGPIDGNGNCAPGCGLQTDLYKNFATFFGNNLPSKGEMGQKQCMGKLDIPAGFDYVNDTCHHLHVASGNP